MPFEKDDERSRSMDLINLVGFFDIIHLGSLTILNKEKDVSNVCINDLDNSSSLYEF